MAKLVFLPDGTYSGTNLPNRVFHLKPRDPLYGPPDWSSVDEISGNWKTRWKDDANQANVVISIEGRISSAQLNVEEGQRGRRLVWYFGDPDSDIKVSFRKEGGLDHTARAHPS
ncbi:hypothetical protein [Paenarthrobacter nitroguajacolicus]|uniref:hypothetical protein n=1 Tax=Paenarthrobacter nitroguajacolicus TaxID=211146 RepID=UPI00341E3CC2